MGYFKTLIWRQPGSPNVNIWASMQCSAQTTHIYIIIICPEGHIWRIWTRFALWHFALTNCFKLQENLLGDHHLHLTCFMRFIEDVFIFHNFVIFSWLHKANPNIQFMFLMSAWNALKGFMNAYLSTKHAFIRVQSIEFSLVRQISIEYIYTFSPHLLHLPLKG